MKIVLPTLATVYVTVIPYSALADPRLKSSPPLPLACDVDAVRFCNRWGPTHFRLLGGGTLHWHDDFIWDLEATVPPALDNVLPLPAGNDR